MSKKIGRNDLCPCGSGKKYKQCCLAKASKPKTLSSRVTLNKNTDATSKMGASIATTAHRPLKAVWINEPTKHEPEPEGVNLIERTFGDAINASSDTPPSTPSFLQEPNVETDDKEPT